MSAPNLYLLTPVITDAEAFAPTLSAVLAAAPFAAVRLAFASAEERAMTRMAKLLVPLVQEAGAAALLDSPADPRLVARCGADGAHFSVSRPDLAEAISELKPDRIVGVGGLRTRHEAMEAGERDLDYLMFGEPRADGSVPELARTIERAEWWSGIFNTPAVAYAADAATLPEVAATGAEFVALGAWLFDSADPAAAAREAAALLGADKPKKSGDRT